MTLTLAISLYLTFGIGCSYFLVWLGQWFPGMAEWFEAMKAALKVSDDGLFGLLITWSALLWPVLVCFVPRFIRSARSARAAWKASQAQ